MTAASLVDDLTGHLLTLLWPLVGFWVYKMLGGGRVGKRPLCKSQIIIKNARVSQTLTLRAGDRLQEVTVKAVSTVLA